MVGNVLLSIGIPTYNRPVLLGRLLATIKSTHSDLFEVIISDNSENNESKNIASQILRNQNFPWKYHKNIPATSATENMNNCIRLARGKYVYIIHDDDFLVEGGLDTMIATLLELKTYQAFMFGVNLVDIDGNIFKHQYYKKKAYLDPGESYAHLLHNSSFIRFPSMVVAREAYQQVGFFDPKYLGADDTDMWIRLFSITGLYCIPDIVSNYTIHEEADTSKMFTKEIIYVLLDLFKKAEKKHLLTEKEFAKSKTNFFHQFILAGTYRALKIKNYDKGKQIMNLFRLPEMKLIPFSYKWYPVKMVFSLILKLNIKV